MTLRVTPAEIVNKAEESGSPGLLSKALRWPRVRLGDVARVVNGAAYSSRHFNVDAIGMPLIRIRDIEATQPSTWYSGEWEEAHLVRHGDILVGMDGDFRVATWKQGNALLNQRVCRIDVFDSHYERGFLRLMLPGYLDAIWQATSSTTVKHLSSRSIADIPLPCPSLQEQRQIVDILEEHLSRLDAAAASIAGAEKRLATMRASRIAQAASLSAPVFSLGGLTVQAGYGTSVKCVSDGPGVAVVRIPNLIRGRIHLQDMKRVADPVVDLRGLMLRRGDLLVVRTNGSRDLIGRTAVVQDGVDAAYASYLIRFVLDPLRVRPEWVQFMLEAPTVRGLLESRAASSAGQYNLSLGKLRDVPIPCPSLSEQDHLLASHASVDERCSRLANALRSISAQGTALRAALLQAAFSGVLTGRSSDLDRVEELAAVGAPA